MRAYRAVRLFVFLSNVLLTATHFVIEISLIEFRHNNNVMSTGIQNLRKA